MPILQLVLLIVGLVFLIKGADFLVEGASAVAKIFKVPSVLIGLTIVSFGTSTPELLTAFTSVTQGSTELFLGDNIGSNITNISLILGLAAVIHPLNLKSHTVWKGIPLALLGALAMLIFALRELINKGLFTSLPGILQNQEEVIGRIDQADGLILLLFFGIFLYYTFSLAKKEPPETKTIETIPLPKASTMFVLGIGGLALGSNLLVTNAVELATTLGVSESLIGATIVAFGTSLPELAATITAARKHEADLLVGNIVGSNIFNTLFVLGLTAAFSPLAVTGQILIDTAVMFTVTLVLFGASHFFGFRQITKTEGGVMLAGYAGYLVYLLT